jgi:hypothetical protein
VNVLSHPLAPPPRPQKNNKVSIEKVFEKKIGEIIHKEILEGLGYKVVFEAGFPNAMRKCSNI